MLRINQFIMIISLLFLGALRCSAAERVTSDAQAKKLLKESPWKKDKVGTLNKVLKYKSPFANACERKKGKTILQNAAKKKHNKVVKCLIYDYGYRTDPNKQDNEGKTALHYAVMAGNAKGVQLILNHPQADILAEDFNGNDIFKCAFEGTKNKKATQNTILALIKGATDRKIDLDVPYGESQETFLHWAAERGYCRVLHTLLEQRLVNPISQDINGHTPLLIAVRSRNLEAVKILASNKSLVHFGNKLDESLKMVEKAIKWIENEPSFIKSDDERVLYKIKSTGDSYMKQRFKEAKAEIAILNVLKVARSSLKALKRR